MKNAILSLALAATIALCGCAGFFVSQNPGGGSGGGGSTTSGYYYVLNGATNQIVGYQITKGTVAPITGGTIALSGLTSESISPNNKFLYVGTNAGIYYYSIASTGALTIGNSGAPISSNVAQSMTVDATNAWLIVANQALATLTAIPLDTTTGGVSSPNAQAVTISSATPTQVILSPDNTHVFVALVGGGTDEVAFNATGTNPFGADVNYPVYVAGGYALSVAVDPSNKFLFVGETLALSASSTTNTGGVRIFSISSTANTLTELSNSPISSGGQGPAFILPDLSGDFLYIANRSVYGQLVANVYGYGYTANSSGTTFTPTALANTPYSSGTATLSLAEDNSKSFIIAVNLGGSPDMNGYTFSTTNPGALSLSISQSTGTDPTGAFAVAAAH
jgi:6-phosphogluconolactonase (cycloisomerase 2 family)